MLRATFLAAVAGPEVAVVGEAEDVAQLVRQDKRARQALVPTQCSQLGCNVGGDAC